MRIPIGHSKNGRRTYLDYAWTVQYQHRTYQDCNKLHCWLGLPQETLLQGSFIWQIQVSVIERTKLSPQWLYYFNHLKVQIAWFPNLKKRPAKYLERQLIFKTDGCLNHTKCWNMAAILNFKMAEIIQADIIDYIQHIIFGKSITLEA